MQTNTKALTIVRGLAFSEVFEYAENSKRVYTDFTGYTFKAQFRATKSSTGKLLATIVPLAVGLGQLKLSLTDAQTALFEGTTAFYDILAQAPTGSPEKIFEGTVTLTDTVSLWDSISATTTATPGAGTYNANQSVVLSTNEAGSTIYYTTDGSAPSVASTKYTAPISVTATTTLRFFSVDAAGNIEAPVSAVYTIDKIAPITTCNQANDATITPTTNITLTADEPATIYYTTDGTAPTTGSTQYTVPFQLAAGTYTIRFFAVDTAGNVEATKSVTNITVA